MEVERHALSRLGKSREHGFSDRTALDFDMCESEIFLAPFFETLVVCVAFDHVDDVRRCSGFWHTDDDVVEVDIAAVVVLAKTGSSFKKIGNSRLCRGRCGRDADELSRRGRFEEERLGSRHHVGRIDTCGIRGSAGETASGHHGERAVFVVFGSLALGRKHDLRSRGGCLVARACGSVAAVESGSETGANRSHGGAGSGRERSHVVVAELDLHGAGCGSGHRYCEFHYACGPGIVSLDNAVLVVQDLSFCAGLGCNAKERDSVHARRRGGGKRVRYAHLHNFVNKSIHRLPLHGVVPC